jgi:hypothetical protein
VGVAQRAPSLFRARFSTWLALPLGLALYGEVARRGNEEDARVGLLEAGGVGALILAVLASGSQVEVEEEEEEEEVEWRAAGRRGWSGRRRRIDQISAPGGQSGRATSNHHGLSAKPLSGQLERERRATRLGLLQQASHALHHAESLAALLAVSTR